MTTTQIRRATALPKLSVRGILARLVAADARYRAARRERLLQSETLRDVGLARKADGNLARRTQQG